MTQLMAQGTTAAVKPQPNIYTVLLFVAIAVLLVGIVVCVMTLTGDPKTGAGYGLDLNQIITGQDLPGLEHQTPAGK